MKMDHIIEFYQILRKENLCFIYQGDFSDGITEKIISLSEYSIDNNQVMVKMKNKISFLIVECFQNIVRHGNSTPKNINRTLTLPSLFSARSTNDCVYITSANLIENSQIPLLKEKLEQLNNLDKEAIKALYLEILSNNQMSSKGGAGLGLVEMARRSGNPLEYGFENENDKLSLFYLMLKMKERGQVSVEDNISLDNVKQIHDVMRREHILLVYKGDFSQDTVIPLLKMIEDNLNKHQEEYNIKKKLYLILVEVLQNVSKHSVEQNGRREAIFMIGKRGQKYSICTGNLIDKTSAEKLLDKINKVNGLDKEGLSYYYKTTLREGIATEKGAGLGIIDIAKESSEKLIYDIKPEGENMFFSLNVSV
jgi:hypothetical protein